MFVLLIVGVVVLGFALVSERIRDTPLTPPIVMTVAGLCIGTLASQNYLAGMDRKVIHTLAEITLVLILFSDAARINARLLVRDHNLPMRLLAIGMPLTILFGAIAAFLMPLGMSWAEAALLACILAPTDAALGQSVLSNPKVPVRIRQALNVESGLNDGIAVPLVILFASFAGLTHASGNVGDHVSFALKQVVLGPLAGIAVGWIAARLLDHSATRGWMTETFEGPAVLATAALAYLAATIIGGNGFISAFVAGLTFGATVGSRCKFILEFAESEGQTLAMLSFVIFGAIMVPQVVYHVTWASVLYAIMSLTVIRMVPVGLALTGAKLNPVTIGFVGWFGPRGLASILFGLLIVEKMHTPATTAILCVVVVTVMISIVLHGISASPLARRYAAMAQRKGECPENMPAPEIASRTGMVR